MVHALAEVAGCTRVGIQGGYTGGCTGGVLPVHRKEVPYQRSGPRKAPTGSLEWVGMGPGACPWVFGGGAGISHPAGPVRPPEAFPGYTLRNAASGTIWRDFMTFL